MYTKEEVLDFVQEEDVKFIRLAFFDLTGKLSKLSIWLANLLKMQKSQKGTGKLCATNQWMDHWKNQRGNQKISGDKRKQKLNESKSITGPDIINIKGYVTQHDDVNTSLSHLCDKTLKLLE